ncbi:MAG: sigma-70 family RNA polymerase sigma factor [Phycisphaerales bacterium]|nr:sigma-70 family RNA polymerase sigma factor [Phycisphaerales bacterium]
MTAMTADIPLEPEPAGDLAGLLRRASEGCDEAWRRVVHLYARRVHAMVRSRCHDDELAEEITQSVFVTVSTKMSGRGAGGYREQGRFESWLFRITMNRVRDEMRRRKRQAPSVDPAGFAGMAAEERPGADEDALGSLRAALELLNDPERQVVEMRHHGQMSFKTIAATLEEPLGTILARHHRALKKLKEALDVHEREVKT